MVGDFDEDDYLYFSQWIWRPGGNGYTVRTNSKGDMLYLHVEIAKRAGIYIEGLDVDHKDRDKLNFRRSNLRAATRSQNCVNCTKKGENQFRGVRQKGGRFQAYYNRDRKQISIGYYDSEIEAAKARDRVVLNVFGEFAVLNFPNRGINYAFQSA